MGLPIADTLAIKSLSRSHVELTTAGLKQYIEKSRWIGPRNRYANDVVTRLELDHPLSVQYKRNLAQYIVASSALHANDGWSYLGRSIACLLAGDPHRALHFAYYAELRAAMSLLASDGIGIFRSRHFVITALNTTDRLVFQKSTHVAAWATLEFWSKQPSSGTLFTRLVRPGGRTLDEWFQPFAGSGGTLALQARDWFLQWGMDLGLATKDRDARNESSYRPDGIPRAWSISSVKVMDFVRDLWAVLEPGASSSFEQIDRCILRLALDRQFHALKGTKPAAGDPTFEAVVQTLGFSVSLEKSWRDFLLRKSTPRDALIFKYSTVEPGDPARDHFAIISRAVLLLRIATGSAHDLLQEAGYDADALSFWWQSVGEARGFWKPGSPPTLPTDLWADVRDALWDIEESGGGKAVAPQSISDLASCIGERFKALCSHERVGLWGLCPA